MIHLDGHPHAFLNQNNIVIGVFLFDNHDDNLLEQVKLQCDAVKIISCCEFGTAGNGSEFYNGKFYDPAPYPSWIKNEELNKWESPIPYPTIEEGSDESYVWDENTTSWLLLPPA
jgi:hypothetical protein